LIDADFLELDEHSFTALRDSTACETWLLVNIFLFFLNIFLEVMFFVCSKI